MTLGNSASIVYPPPSNEGKKSSFVEQKFKRLDDVAACLRRDEMKEWRTCSCMRFSPNNSVAVMRSHDGRGHIKGVITCSSVWACPVCSIKISMKRCEEIKTVLEGSKSTKILITYTIQHTLKDKLNKLLSDLKQAMRYARSGSRKKRLDERYNIEGYIRALEVRYSPKTGWHPHAHEVLLADVPSHEIDVTRLKNDLTAAFRRKLEDLGYFTNNFTVQVDILADMGGKTAGATAAEYITKQALSMSLELTNSEGKSSKSCSLSPFQLVDMYNEAGEVKYLDLFTEYAHATVGRNQLTYSHGLKAKYGVDDKTDKELAEEETKESDIICVIDNDNWKKVLKLCLIAKLIQETAERPDNVINFLAEYGIEAKEHIFQGERVSKTPP